MSLEHVFHSIRFKIIAPVIGIVALAFVGGSMISATLISNRIISGSQQVMNVAADALQGAVVNALWNFDPDQAVKALTPIAGNPEFRLALILDNEGKLFAKLAGKDIDISDSAASKLISQLKTATVAPGAAFTEVRDADALTRSYVLHHVEGGRDSVVGAMIFSASTREAAREANQTLVGYIGASAAVLIVLSLVLYVIVTKVADPISAISAVMLDLAKGNLAVEIVGRERRDEVGAMAAAVQTFKENAAERLRLEQDAAAARAAAEAERRRVAATQAKAAEDQSQALRGLAEGLRMLASGRLTTRLESGFTEAYGQIRDDFNAAVDKLKATMLAVVASADTIHAGTQEVSTAADDLARRTVQQASSLEETTAALGEITATIKKSAEGAGQARQVVVGADQNAKKSAVVVGEAVSAMDGIAKSAEQISQIIGVIDEIAFQTNLLALNAGVEAARAGDAGKGFAVVASEVRALAQRSAEAAKEIKTLIMASSAQVDHGVKLVAETGQSLERIVTQVSEINAVVAGIAAAADQQASALAEINSAIGEMDQMTQQNAAMVEETTAASRSLSQQTSHLADLVAQFHVGQTEKPTRPADAPRALRRA